MKKFNVMGTSREYDKTAIEPFSVPVMASDSAEAEEAVKDDLHLHNRELMSIVKVEEI
jgi:hypothetical protein